MLKKLAGRVLASFTPSTYRKDTLGSSFAGALLDDRFARPLLFFERPMPPSMTGDKEVSS
jgi:hypothetical protein